LRFVSGAINDYPLAERETTLNNQRLWIVLLTTSVCFPLTSVRLSAQTANLPEHLNALTDHATIELLCPLTDHSDAVSIESIYYGEVFTSTRGGFTTKNATQYQGLLDLALTIDFEEMQAPLPGKFFLLAQNTHGRGLTADFIRDTQVISNIDSFNNIMQVSEYWWEFGLFSDDVTIRLGKQDFNTEFVYIDLAADFINSSFGLTPSAALPSYPNPSMAALVLMQLNESLLLKVGVWDALAGGGSWGVSNNDSLLIAGELEYDYALGSGKYPGTMSVGAGYLSGDEVSGEQFGDVHGYSLQFEQLIYRECVCNADTTQGLSIFAAYYPRFSETPVLVEAIGDSLVAGFVYAGLIPGRNEDVFGVGVAWAELFQGGTNEETAVETFYKAQITARLSLQPDVQYIATPSGIYRDALAVGLRFQLAM
jgi:porin